MKKVIIILTIVILTSVLGFMAVKFLKSQPSNPIIEATKNLFPIIGDEPIFNTPTNNSLNTTGTIAPDPLLIKVTDEPVVDFHLVTFQDIPFLIFVTKPQGHIYVYNSVTKEKTRISNKTFTNPEEVYFVNDNRNLSFIVKHYTDNKSNPTYTHGSFTLNRLSDLKNFNQTASVSYRTMPPYLESVSSNTSSNKFVTLEEFANGWQIFSLEPDFLEKTLITKTSFKNWAPTLTNNEELFLQTKPNLNKSNLLYTVKTPEQALDKILTGTPGLNFLVSPSGRRIAYSNKNLVVIDRESGETKIFNDFTIMVPNKCTWSNDELFIFCGIPLQLNSTKSVDEWYKGKVLNTDQLIQMDIQNTNIYPLLTDNTKFDIKSIKMSEDDLTIGILDNTTNNLWLIFLLP